MVFYHGREPFIYVFDVTEHMIHGFDQDTGDDLFTYEVAPSAWTNAIEDVHNVALRMF